MKIAMIGTGYVGLVSGACFAEFGLEVVGVDKDASKIQMLEEGRIPIYEPGLDVLVERHRAAGRLSFTTNLAEAIDGAEAVFYTVVARDTLDAEYAMHRQRFLAEQGYAYRLVDAADL